MMEKTDVYTLSIILDLSVEMPDGQVMEMGSMESVYEYVDTYVLAGHASKYQEAQDPNSIPEDPNANVNETSQATEATEVNETELPSEVPAGISLPAGLPGFEGLYAMIALSVSIVFSRKFKRN